MWLERLSGQSTPSASASPLPAQQRSYSPAPRRSSHLAPNNTPRPSYGPRTSSLGLVSRVNSSTTSLDSPHLVNGSSLRQEIAAPADVVDPVDALEVLLGKRKAKSGDGQGNRDSVTIDQRPTNLDMDIDFQALSLDAFASETSQERVEEPRRHTSQTVEECEYVCPSKRSYVEYC